jgi:predicted Holliday junction resolvase-like endonuclease
VKCFALAFGVALSVVPLPTFAQVPCFTPQACRALRLQAESQQAAIAEQQRIAREAQERATAQAAVQARQAAIRAEQQRVAAEQQRIIAQEQERQALEQQRREQLAEQERERQAQEQLRLAQEQQRSEQIAAEQARRAGIIAEAQNLPALAGYFGRLNADLVFLYLPTSRHVLKGLDGNLSSVVDRPMVCAIFPKANVSGGFYADAMAKLQRLINARGLDVRQCANLDDADVVMFTTADLVVANADQVKALGSSLSNGGLTALLEARQDDYTAKLAADQRQRDDAAAKAREAAANIEKGIDDGSVKGVGILRIAAGQNTCIVDVDQAVLTKALSLAKVEAPQGYRMASTYSLDRAFLGVKTGECPILIATTTSLRKVRQGLQRDALDAGVIIAWVEQSAMDAGTTAMVKERAAQDAEDQRQAAASAAQQAEARRLAAHQAARDEAARAEAARVQAAACASDFTSCGNPTIACQDDKLTSQAKTLLEQSRSPLLGDIKVLKMWNYRVNPEYGFDQHQCAASMVTNRGEMVAFYGWKRIAGDTYITTRVAMK